MGRVHPGIVLLVLAAGCSTYEDTLVELDSVARPVQGEGGAQRIEYQNTAEQLPWYVRVWPLPPMQSVMRALFNVQPSAVELENPPGHARELMATLVDYAEGDLERSAAVAQRLMLVSQLDSSALNRIIALQGSARLMTGLDLGVFVGVTEVDGQPGAIPDQNEWVDVLRTCRPAGRPGGGSEALAPDRARDYRAALTALTARPLARSEQRLALIHDLEQAFLAEGDAELRNGTGEALRAALGHGLRWILLEATRGVEREFVEERRAAMVEVHRLGGPDAVPILLALMATPPEQIKDGVPRFDTDPLLRLKLVHMCGQLDLERARRSVRLPGQEAWEPVAPVDFLCELALNPEPGSPGLQMIATEALCRVLQRPVNLESDWVREWYAANRSAP